MSATDNLIADLAALEISLECHRQFQPGDEAEVLRLVRPALRLIRGAKESANAAAKGLKAALEERARADGATLRVESLNSTIESANRIVQGLTEQLEEFRGTSLENALEQNEQLTMRIAELENQRDDVRRAHKGMVAQRNSLRVERNAAKAMIPVMEAAHREAMESACGQLRAEIAKEQRSRADWCAIASKEAELKGRAEAACEAKDACLVRVRDMVPDHYLSAVGLESALSEIEGLDWHLCPYGSKGCGGIGPIGTEYCERCEIDRRDAKPAKPVCQACGGRGIIGWQNGKPSGLCPECQK